MIAEKITSQALELKWLIGPDMAQEDVERATHACNAILSEAERVAGLEATAIIPDQAESAQVVELQAVPQ